LVLGGLDGFVDPASPVLNLFRNPLTAYAHHVAAALDSFFHNTTNSALSVEGAASLVDLFRDGVVAFPYLGREGFANFLSGGRRRQQGRNSAGSNSCQKR